MTEFFPKTSKLSPKIYGYSENSNDYNGLIKVGYTIRDVEDRMREHYPTTGPDGIERYKILLQESSMRSDGSFFKDNEVHKKLSNSGIEKVGGEWFKCSIKELKAAIVAVRNNTLMETERVNDFRLRPEQTDAINMTAKYFRSINENEKKVPHFLWNCKMRFGKTFTSYKLAKEMKWKNILILTFKPAVENSWKEDLQSHKDFIGWQFTSKTSNSIDHINKSRPFVCFASFQDFLGRTKSGGIKLKNKWAHKVFWDCIILDEYHYGAWRESAKELVGSEDTEEQLDSMGNGVEDWNENISPLTTKHYLYLSGTPFRALESGEFIEEQIYNWSYSDEQKAKLDWIGDNNPYKSLPRMVMMTYKMPESITQFSKNGEFDEFDLNEFFKADGDDESAKFKYEDYVQKWLDLLRGSDFRSFYTNLQLGENKPVLPFTDTRLINSLNHTLWYLPSVASCYAMQNLIKKNANSFFKDYEVIVCAGKRVGVGIKALEFVRKKMTNPIKTKSITLSCGKLCTGVTVKPWSGLFFLRNTSTPETYFQTAFRIQSPWTIDSENNISRKEILKKECYIFDFAPNRALKLITDYSCRLNYEQTSPVAKIQEFIKFLPVICFDGSSMFKTDAEAILDFATTGTSGSQLAKAFESARMIHVDDLTLRRLLENKEALDALMKIEGFRNLNSDLEKIINRTEIINDLKKESVKNDLDKRQKKQLNEEQKERKSLRKKVQEKLQKFATRIPIFMYLTDEREECLKDVITKIESGLFKKVTSLDVKDFELLISLGLFNSSIMNANIFKFRRYEDSSLHYDGLSKHKLKNYGLFDTKITAEEFYSE